MKTEVRKEHGDWIVFVDDNPQFSFMYREEAEKARNMVEVLGEFANSEPNKLKTELEKEMWARGVKAMSWQALKDIGAI